MIECRKGFLFGAVIIVTAAGGISQGDAQSSPEKIETDKAVGSLIPVSSHTGAGLINFQTGNKIILTINMTDGSVKFGTGVTPDVASREFWKNLKTFMPESCTTP